MILTEVLLPILEIVGTIAFALSGAMTAISRHMDLFGVVFLGAVTALGGGVMRDILLGQFPPLMFTSYQFLLLATITALLVFLIAHLRRGVYLRHQEQIDSVNNFFDAVGLAAFTVVGIQVAVAAGHQSNHFFCVFLGMTTGVGGGILRDMMSHAVPLVLRKHIYALASIAGGILYVGLRAVDVDVPICSLASVVLIVTIRMLATHYRWSLPRINFSK